MKAKETYNHEINCWKAVFAIIILLHHTYNLPASKGTYLIRWGHLGVDFFFIVSGVFMSQSAVRQKNSRQDQIRTADYLVKSIRGFYCYFVIAFLLDMAVGGIMHVYEVSRFPYAVFDLMLLRMTGMPASGILGTSWFLSSLLIAKAVLFLMQNKYNHFNMTAAPLTAILIMGYEYQTYGCIGHTVEWNGFLYNGNLRAVMDVSLGCFIYGLSGMKCVRELCERKFVLLLKYSCFICMLYIMIYEGGDADDYLALFFMCVLVLSAFCPSYNRMSKYGVIKNRKALCFEWGGYCGSIVCLYI